MFGKHSRNLTAAEFDRLYDILREHMSAEGVSDWLKRPNDRLKGKSPIEAIKAGYLADTIVAALEVGKDLVTSN